MEMNTRRCARSRPKTYTLLGCAVLSALGSTGVLATEDERPLGVSLYAGVELDNADSKRVDAGAALHFAGGTSIDVSATRTEADLVEGLVVSRTAVGRLIHDFGRVGLGAGVRHSEEQDVADTLGWIAAAFFDLGDARLTANVESRQSELEPTTFTVDGAELGLDAGTVNGTSRCSIDSTAYQLRLNVNRPKWSFHAAGLMYDYRAYDCAITVTANTAGGSSQPIDPAGRSPIAPPVPAIARTFVTDALNRVSGYSSRLVPRESALLESSIMIGASLPTSERTMTGLELYHDVEQFADSASDTLLVFLNLHLSSSWNTELSLGYTQADLVESSAFAGLRISVAF